MLTPGYFEPISEHTAKESFGRPTFTDMPSRQGNAQEDTRQIRGSF